MESRIFRKISANDQNLKEFFCINQDKINSFFPRRIGSGIFLCRRFDSRSGQTFLITICLYSFWRAVRGRNTRHMHRGKKNFYVMESMRKKPRNSIRMRRI